jgi:hypothetical protein
MGISVIELETLLHPFSDVMGFFPCHPSFDEVVGNSFLGSQ